MLLNECYLLFVQVEGIIDGLEVFFPFIPRKKLDKFALQQDGNNDKYLEAEAEFKKADAESSEFADSILKVYLKIRMCAQISIIFACRTLQRKYCRAKLTSWRLHSWRKRR